MGYVLYRTLVKMWGDFYAHYNYMLVNILFAFAISVTSSSYSYPFSSYNIIASLVHTKGLGARLYPVLYINKEVRGC